MANDIDRVWLILTGTGEYVRGRLFCTYAQAIAWCEAHYLPGGWQIRAEENN